MDAETTRLLLDAYNALSALMDDVRRKGGASLPPGSPGIVAPAYALRADIWDILHP